MRENEKKKINNKKLVVLFCGREVGQKVHDILDKDKKIKLKIIVTKNTSIKSKNEILAIFDKQNKKKSWEFIYKELKNLKNFHIILAWWGFTLPSEILSISRLNHLNLHPSYLPYGKGKYSNVWAIINNETYGSSLSTLGRKIDEGKVYIRRKIHININDNAEDIYNRSLDLLIELFKSNYKKIMNNKIEPIKLKNKGSFYNSREINKVKKINIKKKYTFLEISKILNAATFSGKEKPFFLYKKKKYFISFKINEKKK